MTNLGGLARPPWGNIFTDELGKTLTHTLGERGVRQRLLSTDQEGTPIGPGRGEESWVFLSVNLGTIYLHLPEVGDLHQLTKGGSLSKQTWGGYL